MKKKITLLLISLVSTLLTDTTFYFRSVAISIIAAIAVYFFVGFLFYERIRTHYIVNSLLIFLFLITLITSAFIVNPAADYFWISVSTASTLGYIAGIYFKFRQRTAKVSN